MHHHIRSIASLMLSLLILCTFVAVALADTGTAAATDQDVLLELFRAVVNGKWGWLAGVALIFAIEPAKRFLSGRIGFLSSDLGGLALAFVMAVIAGVGHAAIAGGAWNLELAIAIVRNALVAVGGYKAIKTGLVNQFPPLGKLVGASLPKATAVKAGSVGT